MRGHAKSDAPDDPALYNKMEQVLDLKAVRILSSNIGGYVVGLERHSFA
jgi:hypothetical protein